MALGEWPGFGIGGLSVGESKKDMWRTLELLDSLIPHDRPRYLMGVGYPDDLLEAIARGCDMFDCVAPTRNARHGTAWTANEGQINLKGARFRLTRDPIDPGCDCYACRRYDRAYIPSPSRGGRTPWAPPRLDPQPAFPAAVGGRGAVTHPRRNLYYVEPHLAAAIPCGPVDHKYALTRSRRKTNRVTAQPFDSRCHHDGAVGDAFPSHGPPRRSGVG